MMKITKLAKNKLSFTEYLFGDSSGVAVALRVMRSLELRYKGTCFRCCSNKSIQDLPDCRVRDPCKTDRFMFGYC